MATVKNQGKSGFLKEYFVDHPDAGKGAIEQAWRDAGNEGTISESLISKVRSTLGLTAKGRSEVKVKTPTGSGKRSSAAPESDARRTGAKAGGRSAAKADGKNVTAGAEQPARPRGTGGGRTRMLIELEGRIDDMLHEVRMTGGLPEFEEALRRARRILVRSYEE